jgi:hypothetical protein
LFVTTVLAQWVRTSWTTASRGGPEATRRNAAPIGFALPDTRAPLVHEVRMDEGSEFAPEQTITHATPTGVRLTESDGLLRVQLDPDIFGLPRRWRRRPAVRIAPGEWLRWQINYRFTLFGDGTWTYRLDTLNLANGLADPNVFLGTPTRHIDERAQLR